MQVDGSEEPRFCDYQPTRAIAGELPIVSAIRAGWGVMIGIRMMVVGSVVDAMNNEKKKGKKERGRARGSGGNEMRSSHG